MNIFTQRREVEEAVADFKKTGKSVGFVPTMGALHHGHGSLIDFALRYSDRVVVSIFVNPTQFNNQDDLIKYPRNLEADVKFLERFKHKIIVFVPEADEVYKGEVKSRDYNFKGLDEVMEGRFRPGHFKGVGTVLSLLFEIVKPDMAFFGEKDFQQLQIIKKLVEIENIPVKIIAAPISRTPDGLAESSRNSRLTPKMRETAPFIYKTLQEVKNKYNTKSIEKLKTWVKGEFDNNDQLNLEYFEIADAHTLQTVLDKNKTDHPRAFIAVFAGDVRLIDTLALN